MKLLLSILDTPQRRITTAVFGMYCLTVAIVTLVTGLRRRRCKTCKMIFEKIMSEWGTILITMPGTAILTYMMSNLFVEVVQRTHIIEDAVKQAGESLRRESGISIVSTQPSVSSPKSGISIASTSAPLISSSRSNMYRVGSFSGLVAAGSVT